jgi:hypothetical protein
MCRYPDKSVCYCFLPLLLPQLLSLSLSSAHADLPPEHFTYFWLDLFHPRNARLPVFALTMNADSLTVAFPAWARAGQ